MKNDWALTTLISRVQAKERVQRYVRLMIATAGAAWILWALTATGIVIAYGLEAIEMAFRWPIVLVQDFVAFAVCLLYLDRKRKGP